MNTGKILALCSYDFSVSCQAINIMSMYPLPAQKLHWDHGHCSPATSCNSFCKIFATPLPTMSRREMLWQLSQWVRSLFFRIGTRIASAQSLGTFCPCQAVLTGYSSRSGTPVLQQIAFTISSKMPDLLPAFSYPEFPYSLYNIFPGWWCNFHLCSVTSLSHPVNFNDVKLALDT